ncbi:aspartyl aminopeptidase [Ophiocordyceps sinensis CO18]|uniref:aspartyl aminopeptidase n=1 Tax=Ophiocordyceps sinensis (strain Co18 / CGMCC 3.14243) TaxID=911162 RepID=T5AD06_OPHSC|nr:aspartyl aminopeptidase [Ophiocordyceps sinensis CO18]
MAPPKPALDFVDFVNASPTPYHAVRSAAARFEKAGFALIRERDSWASSVKPGGKYYLTRNGSSIVAFAVGHKWQAGNPVDKPLLRIPTLAIHLDRDSSFDPNKETELFPIAGLAAAELNKGGPKDDEQATADKDDFQPLDKMTARHHPALLDVIAGELGVEVAAIADFELVLYDTQKSCIGGLADELIFSPRLDNLGMTYCAVMGLISSVRESSSLEKDTTIRLAACFDHEEIGSQSAQGAHSNLLPSVLRRLSVLPGARDTSSKADEATEHEQTLSRSFLVSADMAHAVHPNYAGKYEASHQPALNKGTVIKVNANQRYATNSPGIVLVQECARLAGVPLQLFVVRNDSACGSTIGPGLAAKMGMRTLDLGNPQLSMHSIRETGGTADVEHGLKLFHHFYHNYGRLEPKILID